MNNELPIIHHALYRPSPVRPSAHPAKNASFTQAYWDAATDKAGKHKIVDMAYAQYSPYGVRFDVGLPEALYVPIGGELHAKDVELEVVYKVEDGGQDTATFALRIRGEAPLSSTELPEFSLFEKHPTFADVAGGLPQE